MGQPPAAPDETAAALLELLEALSQRDYRFITPTDATHRLLRRRRAGHKGDDLHDVFGWSLPFEEDAVEPSILALMRRARIVQTLRSGLRSRLRVSSLGDRLFFHSSFPTHAADAVFFGPDTYRFARFLQCEMKPTDEAGILVDIGCGCGAGGVFAAGLRPSARLVLADVNPLALRLAAVNARHAGVRAETVLTSGLDEVKGSIRTAIANPPFMAGRDGSTYQDGRDMHGAAVSIDWARAAMARLARRGRMLLYTGSAIVDGRDRLKDRLSQEAKAHGCTLDYEEIDPDIFGEELRRPAYAEVERIAAVGAVITRR